MDVTDRLNKFFNRKKSIQDITSEELQRERIRLEQEESKLIKRIDDLEVQKKQLFMKGKDETSVRQQRIFASKIKEVDVQARNLDRNLQLFSHQLRIINGFVQLKENQRLLTESGVSSVINKMDLATLQTYIEQATVNESFNLEKLQDIVRTLEEGHGVMEETRVDEDVDDIVKMFQETKAAETENPMAVEDGMKKLDTLLKPKEEAEREV